MDEQNLKNYKKRKKKKKKKKKEEEEESNIDMECVAIWIRILYTLVRL
jgi:hypothetical protein